MKKMTVSEVSRKFDVSTRMLRYYEQEGLICSLRKEGYAYRVYDEEAGAVMDSFIRESKLFEAKPDARLFGFETVRDMALDGEHGYENWVTIPEAFEVTAPLIKKQFLGGLYAVHTIDFPNFNEWERLKQWVEKHEI